MSYGQPWRRITVGPFAGPASAYPTFNRPASIFLIEPNEAFDRGLLGIRSSRWVLLDCAPAERLRPSDAAARVVAAVPRNWRRGWLMSSDISLPPLDGIRRITLHT